LAGTVHEIEDVLSNNPTPDSKPSGIRVSSQNYSSLKAKNVVPMRKNLSFCRMVLSRWGIVNKWQN
jgi:hypothetical protein